MDIHEILHLKLSDDKNTIKQSYYKMLFHLHPHNNKTGDEQKYIALQNAYKKYIAGHDYANCFAVVTNEHPQVLCRCGGFYLIHKSFTGRIECDFCSCYVQVEEIFQKIEGSIA